MKKLNKRILLFALVLMGSILLGTTSTVWAAKEETIEDGVYIGNVYVGGMNKEEAAEAIRAYMEDADTAVFTFSAEERQIEVEASEIGIRFSDDDSVLMALDVGRSGSILKRYRDKKELEKGNKIIPMSLDIDASALRTIFEENAKKLNQEVVNNGLIREKEEFRIVKGERGIEVNIEASVAMIESYIRTEWDGEDVVLELITDVVEPIGTEEELSRVGDLLGSFQTKLSGSAQNRLDNIELATSRLDGIVLYPGEEISVGEAMGPLTAAGGYKLAGAYENGQEVQDYGGGVCQVSTTLYNAAILAELEITERFNHSMTVAYVPLSQDAAIAGNYKDLKFVNNQDAPIYIEGYTLEKELYFNIYGEETRPANREVSFVSEMVSRQEGGVQFVGTGDPAGHMAVTQESRTGYVSRLWKIVKINGIEESREIFNKSTYRATPKLIQVGTASADPNISAAIGAALATGDEATVYAAVAPYAPPAPAPTE
ncbi:MAG: VanW family protein [Roseburia sp.]